MASIWRYSKGDDAHEVQSAGKRLNLDVNVMKVERIQMILFMVLAELLQWGNLDLPSHEISQVFLNLLDLHTAEDFVAKFKEIMSAEPQPLTPEEQHKLSCEAATQRFMEYSDLDKVLSSETSLDRRCRKSMWKSVFMPNLD